MVGTPTCSSSDTNFPTNCSTSVPPRITYTLQEKTGTNTYGSALTASDNSVVTANGGTRTYKVTLTYNATDDAGDLPTALVNISGLGIVFSYTQEGAYQAP